MDLDTAEKISLAGHAKRGERWVHCPQYRLLCDQCCSYCPGGFLIQVLGGYEGHGGSKGVDILVDAPVEVLQEGEVGLDGGLEETATPDQGVVELELRGDHAEGARRVGLGVEVDLVLPGHPDEVRPRVRRRATRGDELRLRQMFLNLISNGIKYTPDNGELKIALAREGDFALVDIVDSGIGIDAEHLSHIFDRFYRVGNSFGHGSSGIGLALAKRFVELHKGTITVDSTPNVYTVFRVLLPKGKQHSFNGILSCFAASTESFCQLSGRQ